jgi:alpha-L-fucosidase
MPEIKKGPFEPTLEGLAKFECPEWFRDAKFGIWSHWGPQSVPMFGDWYARNMYIEGSDQYRYHCRVYGHPSEFGYKDIINLWKAERFNPAELMDLFVQAGAKYFVAQAMHHDNFDNYDSSHPYNSVNMGPKKDICAMWQKEARRHNLPFGLTEHQGASYTWFAVSKAHDKSGLFAAVPYDGGNKDHETLYRDNDSEIMGNDCIPWYTVNEKYHIDWFNRIKELIDKFSPDLLYSDGALPFGKYGEHIVAHLYNTSASLNGGKNNAVYNNKGLNPGADINPAFEKIGVFDIERGVAEKLHDLPWQDDTSIGDWFYNVKDVYKTPEEIIDTLVDIVSKNGNLLMNVPQLPDGTIDYECRHILEKIGAWMKDNSDGIYAARPYKKFGEGNALLTGGKFNEGTVRWTSGDFRFTRKGDAVFAYSMRPENNRAEIKTLGRLYENAVKSVSVHGKPAEFVQKDGCLFVSLPDNPHKGMPMCIKIDT